MSLDENCSLKAPVLVLRRVSLILTKKMCLLTQPVDFFIWRMGLALEVGLFFSSGGKVEVTRPHREVFSWPANCHSQSGWLIIRVLYSQSL